ncbi:L-threonine 3-dehydrogenase [Herbiconiux sp. VKM Ac-1786]|uniref:L-threonine 3-dehydrogenase n=1 Tax=Herbiconiux sp. VKM Ac-1786 TaxID=2783824 RepID=UPI00188A6821|nr:L-threonine 3-dehydrogenase [Herbiconiux sp. VKM Ac-1786]MBF4571839.1 L-threonine 3-dehydrogenase [Herbiconiux sp. VKM Ac-1786]
MKALAKDTTGPGLVLTDRPDPVGGPFDVTIAVLRTGICGTDLHIESWDDWAAGVIRPPLIPGHEFSGRVVEVGDAVTSVRVGDLVSGEGHIVCGVCRNCRAGRRHLCVHTLSVGVNRDGAFAQYVALPEQNIWVHPADIDLDLAAIFDPLGNAVHTALSYEMAGEDVLITGAGPIGLMAARVAKHVGSRNVVITDVNAERLALARSMGVDVAVDVSSDSVADAQQTLGMREGFDVGLEISGRPSALVEMLENMNHGGKVALLGLPTERFDIDWASVVGRMITIKGIYGRQMFETWYLMAAMLHSGLDVQPVITDRLPAADWAEGFDIARRGAGGKVVLDWSTL